VLTDERIYFAAIRPPSTIAISSSHTEFRSAFSFDQFLLLLEYGSQAHIGCMACGIGILQFDLNVTLRCLKFLDVGLEV
jgi:hypothetical protein